MTKPSERGGQSPAPRTQLHRIGQLGKAKRGVVSVVDVCGGKENRKAEVSLLRVALEEAVEPSERGVTEARGLGLKVETIGPTVVHGALYQVEHSHERELIGGSIHDTKHVHLHIHIGGSDEEVIASIVRGDTGIADNTTPIVVLFHAHEHKAVGRHPLAFRMGVTSHDPNRGFAVMVMGRMLVWARTVARVEKIAVSACEGSNGGKGGNDKSVFHRIDINRFVHAKSARLQQD